MGKFAIKKRVSLDFLGDDYKEAYLVFQSIPLKDFEGIIKAVSEGEDNKNSLGMISEYLQKYFIEGKFPNGEGQLEDVTSEDLTDFADSETANRCFEILTGQNIDPKVEAPSMNTSTTDTDSVST